MVNLTLTEQIKGKSVRGKLGGATNERVCVNGWQNGVREAWQRINAAKDRERRKVLERNDCPHPECK